MECSNSVVPDTLVVFPAASFALDRVLHILRYNTIHHGPRHVDGDRVQHGTEHGRVVREINDIGVRVNVQYRVGEHHQHLLLVHRVHVHGDRENDAPIRDTGVHVAPVQIQAYVAVPASLEVVVGVDNTVENDHTLAVAHIAVREDVGGYRGGQVVMSDIRAVDVHERIYVPRVDGDLSGITHRREQQPVIRPVYTH